MLVAALTRALERLGIPVLGVSIGDEHQRETWRIDYAEHATPQQRQVGDGLLASYDYSSDTAYHDELAAREFDEQRALKAAVLTSLWGRLGRQPNAQEINAERSRFLLIYKAL